MIASVASSVHSSCIQLAAFQPEAAHLVFAHRGHCVLNFPQLRQVTATHNVCHTSFLRASNIRRD